MGPDEIRLSKNEKKVKLDGLTDLEITNYFRGEKNFGGVYANDELKQPEKDKVYILNLQNSNQGGSHWVLLFNGFYIDSYGVPPTKTIAPLVKAYSPFMFQSFNQESCGYYVMYFASNILAGRNPFGDLIPGEKRRNERVLKKYFY